MTKWQFYMEALMTVDGKNPASTEELTVQVVRDRFVLKKTAHNPPPGAKASQALSLSLADARWLRDHLCAVLGGPND